MKKAILIVLAIVVIGAGLITWRVLANLDAIVASLIESEGSKALGTQVSVTGVEIDLRGGAAAIAGLTVANPAGWTAANAFELDRVSVDIDLASLKTPVIVLSEVDIDAARVAYEMRANGKNNLQELLSGMQSGSEEDEAPAEDQPASDIRLRIDSLEFEGLTATARVEDPRNPGEIKEEQLSLPPLAMSAVGGSAGAPPQKIAAQISGQMAREVIEAAAKKGFTDLIREEAGKLGEKLSDMFRKE
ncbi:MAG: AsmA family protein [Halieaceae bacterium]|jgi:uncharacterized protein involved in outer membrane biogenesis|nr:AsmA family protein [Halieaceae bacterium]